MNIREFLTLMWPDAGNGYYCLATPFTPPGRTTPIFAHRVVSSIAAAANFADEWKLKKNIFYCIHTLVQDRVWNPRKKDPRTGETGAYEVRTQANTQAAKVFFFDLDVGPSEEGKSPKYATPREAVLGLKDFVGKSGLPEPMVVGSGGGLHVYWIMDQVLPVAQWRLIAAKLKKLAQTLGLKMDPSRTTDSASVLRVVGTFNLKKDEPRPVRLYTPPRIMQVGEFEAILDAGLIRQGAVVPVLSGVPAKLDDFNNVAKVFDGPPVKIKSLLSSCPQIFRVAQLGGNVSEPEWYAALSAVRLVENGDKYVHKISNKHPEYDPAATDAKVQQLADKDIGPTGCEKWHDMNPAICETCQFWQKIKSPMTAARRKLNELPPPVATYTVGQQQIVELIPAVPKGYTRSDKGVFVQKTDKDGNVGDFKVYDHDLYPLRRVINRTSETEDQVWRAELPRIEQPHDFTIPADALYDSRKLSSVLANNGVYPSTEYFKELQTYMVAYIAKLQMLNDAEVQCNHLGWTKKNTEFILPDKVLIPGQDAERVTLSKGAKVSAQHLTKAGTIQRQIELLDFYNKPAYVPQQFFILCGLAAPIFRLTGHHGVVVNASGKTGASKSSALYTAAAFWGDAALYPINGTNKGATMRGRAERVAVLANLPICVDEITDMPNEEAKDMVMSITQPGHRIRLEKDGTEKAALDSYKATIMMTTANTSLHTILAIKSAGGTAGSMRTFEIMFSPNTVVHTKPEADDYLHEVKQNYGWIGEVFMKYVVDNCDAVEVRVRETMRRIDLKMHIAPGERFWSATIASVLVAGEIAHELGLCPFDTKLIEKWLEVRQVPYMRGVVRDEYTSPIGALANYLESINDNILVVQRMQATKAGNIALVSKMPHGALLARYEQDTGQMFVLRQGFKDYCAKHGLNERQMIDELFAPVIDKDSKTRRIVINKHIRKVLGAGTDLSKSQAYVIVIDMTHPEVAGNPTIASTTKP